MVIFQSAAKSATETKIYHFVSHKLRLGIEERNFPSIWY